MLKLETLYMLVISEYCVIYQYFPPNFFFDEQSPKILRKSNDWNNEFWTLLEKKKSWLAVWFIFELIGVGGWPW